MSVSYRGVVQQLRWSVFWSDLEECWGKMSEVNHALVELCIGHSLTLAACIDHHCWTPHSQSPIAGSLSRTYSASGGQTWMWLTEGFSRTTEQDFEICVHNRRLNSVWLLGLLWMRFEWQDVVQDVCILVQGLNRKIKKAWWGQIHISLPVKKKTCFFIYNHTDKRNLL